MAKNKTSEKNNKVCQNCGAILINNEFCSICGAKNGKLSNKTVETISDNTTPLSPSQLYSQRRFAKLVSVVLVITILTASLAVGVGEYLSFNKLKSIYNTEEAILYQQNNGLLKIRLSSDEQPIVLDKYYNNSTSNIKVLDSYDNRFIAYLGNQKKIGKYYKGTLSLVDLIDIDVKSNAGNIKKSIVSDKDVIDFYFRPKSNSLVFLTSDGDLYECNYNNLAQLIPTSRTYILKKLDSNVKGIVNVSFETIFYYKGENTNPSTLEYNQSNNDGIPFDLYRLSTSKNVVESSLVDNNVYNISDISKSYNDIIYTKFKKENFENQFSVFHYSYENNLVTPLADNVFHIAKSDATKGEVLFLSKKDLDLDLSEILEDDLLGSDLLLKNPDELTALPEGISSKEDEDFKLLITEYEKKVSRDEVRKKLKSIVSLLKNRDHIYSSLYYIKNISTKPTLIEETVLGFNGKENIVFGDLEKGYALFTKIAENNSSKFKMSNLEEEQINTILSPNYSELDFISEHIPESLMLYSVLNNESSVVHTERGDHVISDYSISDQLNEIYFLSKPNFNSTTATFYMSKFSDKRIEPIIYIDEYVHKFIGSFNGLSPGIIYQTASKDTPPEYILYDYTEESIVQIADKTSPYEYIDILGQKKDSIYFFRNYDNETKIGNLFVYNNDNENFLAADISQYQPLSSGELLLIQNENNFSNLLSFKDARLKSIDQNIENYHYFDDSFYP